MSYSSLVQKYPEIQQLFDHICTVVNDEGRDPAELLPDAVRWLQERIKDSNDLNEAAERVNRYLKFLKG